MFLHNLTVTNYMALIARKVDRTMINVKHLLKEHAYLNIPLNYDEAYELGRYALTGCDGDALAQIQSIAVLSALHSQATYKWQLTSRILQFHGHYLPNNAAEQIAGICAAIFDHDIAKSEFGFLNPDLEFAMDNCGMGGDLVVTANISTLAALIAASAGVPMCKHGSPANADKGHYGSSDFVSLICGIDTFADARAVTTCLEKHHFAYTEATDIRYKKIHLQTHAIAKLPHMNDIIGPITNPLHPNKLTHRVVGLNQLIPARIVAEAYLILNQRQITSLQHGIFVRGFVDPDQTQGMDEVSLCAGGTQVAELCDGHIVEYQLTATDFGVETIDVEDVNPIGSKGPYSLSLLQGKYPGPRSNLVIANAAILFKLAGKSDNLTKAFRLAEEILYSGQPLRTMLNVQHMLPRQ